MSDPVSKIHIALEAEANQLDKGLQTGIQKISGFAGRARGLFAGAIPTGIFMGIGQAIGQNLAGQFSRLIGPQMELIDGLAKQADLMGLSTERLTAYRHAAGLAGLESDQLDGAIRKMNKQVAEAAAGGGKAAATLDLLGLSATHLASLPTDQRLKSIADALDGVEGAGNRAMVSGKLFGDGAAAMGQLLRGGSEALDQYATNADELGLSLSRVDAAKVEIANDAITTMSAIWDAFVKRITVAIAPTIAALAETMTEAGKAGQSAADWIAGAFENVGWVVAMAGDILTGIQGSIDILVSKFLSLGATIVDVFAKLDSFTGNRLFGGSLDAYAADWDARAKALDASGMARLTDAFASTTGDKFMAKIREAERAAETIADTAMERLEGFAIEAEEKTAKAGRDTGPAALQQGSQAAYSAIQAAQRQQASAQQLSQQQLTEAQQQTRALVRIERAVSQGNIGVAAL